MLDGWKGPAVIVAAFALLGVLVALKVEGAAVAAISAVTIVIAWLTKSPRDGATPPGASIVPIAAVGLAALGAVMTHGCAPVVSRPAEYGDELRACNASARSLAESLACEDEVRARFGRPLLDAGSDGAR